MFECYQFRNILHYKAHCRGSWKSYRKQFLDIYALLFADHKVKESWQHTFLLLPLF